MNRSISPAGNDGAGHSDQLRDGYKNFQDCAFNHFATPFTELTARTRPDSIESIAQELSRTLRGWFRYFRHGRWTIYKDLDAKKRSRLRRLLLKRHRRNPARLPRNHRWPNDYFAKMGLYSLREAHFRFDQSVNY